MAARGLTAADVAGALRANNVQAAPGQLKGSDTVINVTASTDVTSLDGFRAMVVKHGEGGLVRLGDIATVEIGGQNYDSSATTEGKRSVMIAVSPTPDGNPLEIVKAVKALLPEIQRAAPPGVRVFNQFDVAHFVDTAIDEVSHTLVEAVNIVVVVIFLFLGSLRAVVIRVVTIPLSLIGKAALMLAFGFTLNLLTLLAMVLAIGLVVDDAIVVVENIHRHIEEGLSPVRARWWARGDRGAGGGDDGHARGGLCAHRPHGRFDRRSVQRVRIHLGRLRHRLRRRGPDPVADDELAAARGAHDRRQAREVHRTNDVAARPGIRAPAGAYAGTAARGASRRRHRAGGDLRALRRCPARAGATRGQGLRVRGDEGAKYANVDYTARYSHEVETIFQGLPEYASSWFANGVGGTNSGFGGTILKEWHERQRSAAAIQEQLNAEGAAITGVYATAFQPPALPAGSGGFPVQMVLRAPVDFSELYTAVEKIKGAAWGSGLFAFVDSDLAFDSQEARIVIDRAKAGEIGVTMQAIAETLAVLVGENYINRFNWHDRAYDVITQVPHEQRLTPDNLGKFYVRAASGTLVPLATVVRFEMRPEANRLLSSIR